MSTRCAIYLRQSLDPTGEQLAIQRQRDDCHRLAEQRSWEIVAEYVDNSISASDNRKRRPGYEALVAAYRAGEIEAVVCWDLDRLTRQPRQLEDWIDAATERGLVLVTANGEADLSTDAGRLFARIKASVARAEVERKAARQRAAAYQRSERGRPPLGVRLTGYTVAGETVADEAAVVRQVFDRFAAGDSLRSIAAWLTTTGTPTRRGSSRWNPSTVRGILTNPRYAGRAVYQGAANGKRGMWKAIVAEDVFDAVRVRLADPRRATNKYGTDRKYLGAGLYLCDPCGEPLVSFSQVRYYCRSCGMSRSRRQVDELIEAVIRERLGRPDVRDLLPTGLNVKAKAAEAEARRLHNRLAQIEADYDAELIDGRRYKVASEKARAALASAETSYARLSGSTSASSVLLAQDPVTAYEAAPLMIRRNVISTLIAVRLRPAMRGRQTFDPASVIIEPAAA